ncbi:UbiA family prenyltransferase [Mariniblastus fucicola]|uniref:(S)-2,3-di-O-geranylgeranylglyceryl phosphate synthase n=1 Tax=Mariniblastus fucicola TaxID=980251 RepID=A0A5B9PFG2_9BACT|nr:UbiA family prenyltransferase [Mariniblastus fucicola]QEG23935.1 (S)-2,3-di-O-geranylgeranylglyceryl phosphate synthase [Mariniblastus fucicola]
MAWLRLLRIAALPSALANLLIGYLLANLSWQPALPLVWLLLSSACLYLAGMVLNDVFDIEIDRVERPSRPLPSASVSLSLARMVGYGLLIAGPIFAALASVTSLIIAIGLAIAVYLYDGPLKRTLLAPALMGSCRTLNILLGASTVATIPSVAIWYAVGIGVFVAGITLLARREAETNQSASLLIPGSALMVGGMLVIGYFVWTYASQNVSDPKLARFFPLAFGFLFLPILRRLAIAISKRSGSAVQATVITSLRSLILFDACTAMLIENGRPYYSIVFVGLLAASWLLGRATRLT